MAGTGLRPDTRGCPRGVERAIDFAIYIPARPAWYPILEMMLETWHPIVVTAGAVIAALVVMVGFWRLVVRFLSESSNWPELVRRFPSKDRPEGRIFGHQAATLHGVAHQGILRVIPSASGFYVEIERPFSYREPPLLVPWSAFRELKEYRSLLGWRHYELVLSEEEVFLLWRRAGEAVREHFKGRHRVMPGRTLWPIFARLL